MESALKHANSQSTVTPYKHNPDTEISCTDDTPEITEVFSDGSKLADYAPPQPDAEMSALLKIQKLAQQDKIKAELARIKMQEEEDKKKMFGDPEQLKKSAANAVAYFKIITRKYYEIPEKYLWQLSTDEVCALAERILNEKNWFRKTLYKYWGGTMLLSSYYATAVFLIYMAMTASTASKEWAVIYWLIVGLAFNPIMILMWIREAYDNTFGDWIEFRKELNFIRKYRGTHYFPSLNP